MIKKLSVLLNSRSSQDSNFAQVLLFLLLVLYAEVGMAQCPDFTDLSSTNVTCQYGNTDNPFAATGIAIGRHTLITEQGSDAFTGNALPFLPPGESRVIRLGNERVGAEAEAVTYRFTVEEDYAILLLKFAVVFEDPGHIHIAQPRFVVRVLNQQGELTEECAEYDVRASGDIPGFQSYSYGWHNVRWRPWTNVGIDLSDYIGQNIQVQFITYDCDYYGHFGYAYFTAHCISNQLALTACNGETVTLTAPAGFENYQWSNGTTGTSAHYTVNNGNLMANCILTSATGCQFTLNALVTNQSGLPTQDQTILDTICQGEPYTDHFFNLPAQNQVGTFTHVNSLYNLNSCDGDVQLTLFLTVLQRNHTLTDAVCQGQDYSANGFQISAAEIQARLDADPGNNLLTFTTTLPITSECEQQLTLYLTVTPSLQMPNIISGNQDPCTGELESYTLSDGGNLTDFHWIVPDGVNILYGQGTSSLTVFFSDNASVPTTLTLQGTNGCGSGSIPLTIVPHRSYHLFFNDTICSGNPYTQHGFNLPQQDSTGWFVFTNPYTTAHGCDSIQTLQLLVTGMPTLTTLAHPEVLCSGDSVTIHALGENAGFAASIGTPPTIAIGDILCTDNTIIKPQTYAGSGKTAKGVVFYVDATGQHGWVVKHTQINIRYEWSSSDTDILSLPNITTLEDALSDYNGYTNTQRIRTAGNATAYPAAYQVDFDDGWYLPATGQLRILYGNISDVIQTLTILQNAGVTVNLFTGGWYWSSTEYNSSYAWYVLHSGYLYYNLRSNISYVREVRAF